MTLQVKVSDAWKSVSDCSVKVSGAWKAVAGIWVKVDGVWKLAFGTGSFPSTLAVSMQNAIVSGSRSNAGSVTSSAAVGLPTGGDTPYAYLWTRVSGDTFTINTPTAVSTTFTTSLSNGQSKSGVYQIRVTDSATPTPGVVTAQVTVNQVSTYVPPPPSLSVSVSPGSLSGFVSGAGSAFTGSSTATVSGGSGNYSYSWGGTASGVGVSSYPSGNSCSFGVTIPANSTWNGSFGVTVTDNETGATGSAGGSLFFAASA